MTEDVAARLGGDVTWQAADGGLREYGPLVAATPAFRAAEYGRPVSSPFDAAGRTTNVNVVTHYPAAEPVSTTVNRALQYAAAIGES